MYFTDRLGLGEKLSERTVQYGHSYSIEPIILCLRETALETSIMMARMLHGWVFPFLTERIHIPGENRLVGVINPDGEFSYDPALSRFEIEEILMEFHSVIENEKREGSSRLNKRLSEYSILNKHAMNGRVVVLCGDILRDQIEIEAANLYLKPLNPKRLISVSGNISPDSFDRIRLISHESITLDVVPNMFEDSHYFEKEDTLSDEDKKNVVINIAKFWL